MLHCAFRRAIPWALVRVPPASVAAAGTFVLACVAQATIGHAAEGFPARALRFVVPFPPGGSVDIVARTLAERLGERLGQTVVVDNRGGANGNIGAELVARAVPDGHTLLMGNIGTHGINPFLYAKAGFDPVRDFAPVTLVSTGPLLMTVHPGVAATSVGELVALARSRPGQIHYASAAALTDLVAGRVHFFYSSVFTAQPQIRAGRVRALAVTSLRRSRAAPDVPTVDESGYRGYEATGWNGVLVPAATPRSVVARLNAELVTILQSDEVRERLFVQGGAEVAPSSPDAFAAFIRAELTKWANVARAANLARD
jgi:tripartite-type tricarboxylate transporter receptor subunit TctC